MYFSRYRLNKNCRRRLSDPKLSVTSLVVASFLSITLCRCTLTMYKSNKRSVDIVERSQVVTRLKVLKDLRENVHKVGIYVYMNYDVLEPQLIWLLTQRFDCHRQPSSGILGRQVLLLLANCLGKQAVPYVTQFISPSSRFKKR